MEDLSGGVLSLDHRYEVIELRPYGGLAMRYGGRQQPFNMDVDLWVMDLAGKLSIAPVAAAAVAARLEALARSASLMRSPHILKVLDYGEVDENAPFILTESVEGPCLQDIIKHQGRLPLDGTVKVIEEVALALEDAHQHGFGHLGVRADHVWFEQTPSGAYARLGGIGCCLLKHEIGLIDTEVDLSGAQVDHLAPESFDTAEVRAWRRSLTSPFRPGFDGDWADQPTAREEVSSSPEPLDPVAFDVFGLAVMAYRCLTGAHPYIEEPGQSAADQLRALATADLIDPSTCGIDLPPAVWRVLKGALARDPGARPDGALAFSKALAEAATPPAPAASAESFDIDVAEPVEGPFEMGGDLRDPEELALEQEFYEPEGTFAALVENPQARILVAVIALLFITNLVTLIMLGSSDPAPIPLSAPAEATWSEVVEEGPPAVLEEAPTALDPKSPAHYQLDLPDHDGALEIIWSPEGTGLKISGVQ